MAHLQPEHAPTNDRQNSHDRIVPHQQRVVGQRDEREPNGGRDGVHEERDRLHHGAHIRGRLGVRILEAGDGRHDLGEGDQDVRAGLRPHADLDARAVALGAVGHDAVGVAAALALLVDVVLDDAGPDHGRRGDKVADGDALERRRVEAHLAQGRVDEQVEQGDHDDEGEGVEVGQDVVGHAADLHGGGLRDEVVVDWDGLAGGQGGYEVGGRTYSGCSTAKRGDTT